MASVTSLESLDKTSQMEIAATNFRTNGHILTAINSALHANFDDTVQWTNRDAMKRKLTARVSPMTRPPDGVLDTKFYPQFANLQNSHQAHNFKKTELDVDSTTSSVPGGKQRLAEKRKSTATNVIIPSKAVKSESFLTTQDEPASKRPRTILPRTMQVPEPEIQKTPVSPEPKLMSDNVATMSLLSATECHLATLQDEDGDTPLHIAIAHGNTQLVEYLINLMSCLTLDIYNNLKQTPLHLAVITEQAHIVGKLTTAGANVNLPDRNGQTPTHLACQRSSTGCIRELCKAANCPDLELTNFNGFTPLHEAVFASCPEAVQCLVDHGANVNCKDGKSGRTPLHHAVETENLEVIQELLKCGANVSAGSFSGNTPLQVASGRCMQNVRLLLESAGSNIKSANGNHKEVNITQPPVIIPNYEDRRHVMVKNTYV